MSDEQARLMHDRFIVRMPQGWRDAIKVRAARNRRSMNQEILIALECVVGVAAGEDLGGHAPAAGTTEENPNHQKDNHHERDDSAIRA